MIWAKRPQTMGEDKPAGDIALLDVFLALVVGVHGDV